MGSSPIGHADTLPPMRITQSMSKRQNSGRSAMDFEMHLIRPVLVVPTPPNDSAITPPQTCPNSGLLVLSVRVSDAEWVFYGIQVHSCA